MTNAGKTFTITGTDDNPGLLPRTLAALFRHIEGGVPAADASGKPTGASVTPSDLVVLVSYLEVYNDQCYDLLAHSPAAGAGAGAGAGASAVPAFGPAQRVALPIKDGR